MNSITIDQVISKVRELAAQYPSTVYASGAERRCMYLEGNCSNGSVGCIFGQALVSVDADIEVIRERDQMPQGDNNIQSLLRALNIEFTEQQGNWCDYAQSEQDREVCWADAVEHTDAAHPLEDDIYPLTDVDCFLEN